MELKILLKRYYCFIAYFYCSGDFNMCYMDIGH
eukprot:UN07177